LRQRADEGLAGIDDDRHGKPGIVERERGPVGVVVLVTSTVRSRGPADPRRSLAST
jgi:hypothetical protein